MLKVKYILQILFLFLILCCSKDEVENTGRPGVPNLVFPENNTPCLSIANRFAINAKIIRGDV